jgi:hypothetical protein
VAYIKLFQVRGPVPLNGSICPYTRNVVDGGIQSSHLGVDVWKLPTPQYRPNMNTTIHDFPINPSIAGIADLLVCNNSWRKIRRDNIFILQWKLTLIQILNGSTNCRAHGNNFYGYRGRVQKIW